MIFHEDFQCRFSTYHNRSLESPKLHLHLVLVFPLLTAKNGRTVERQLLSYVAPRFHRDRYLGEMTESLP